MKNLTGLITGKIFGGILRRIPRTILSCVLEENSEEFWGKSREFGKNVWRIAGRKFPERIREKNGLKFWENFGINFWKTNGRNFRRILVAIDGRATLEKKVYIKIQGGIAGKLPRGVLKGFRQKFFERHRVEIFNKFLQEFRMEPLEEFQGELRKTGPCTENA